MQQWKGRRRVKTVSYTVEDDGEVVAGKFAEEAREVSKRTKREMAELTFQIIGRVLERMPQNSPEPVQDLKSLRLKTI